MIQYLIKNSREAIIYMKNSKLLKTLLIPTLGISAIGIVATISTSCASQICVDMVMLDKNNLELSVNESGKLTATVFPSNATNKSIKWFSYDDLLLLLMRTEMLPQSVKERL